MADNLKIWDAFADIDPKFTKQISGKAYKGTSPNPQYVIRCLTELFGPVGIGFGWRVLADGFQPLGEKTLHWCRIEFWHTNKSNTYEEYGQTLAAYPTNGGGFVVDEDAPKKSQTDAIVKAASHLGVAANIFLGRWDDQKHVAAVSEEFRAKERAQVGHDLPQEAITVACESLGSAETVDALNAIWRDLPAEVKAEPSVLDAAKSRKSEITRKAA